MHVGGKNIRKAAAKRSRFRAGSPFLLRAGAIRRMLVAVLRPTFANSKWIEPLCKRVNSSGN